MAIELGYLTPTQLESLLASQKRTRPRLGEIVVDKGWFSRSEMLERLDEYHRASQ